MERYRSFKKLHRKVDYIISTLNAMRIAYMATWQDVKDAIAYDREVDAKVMAKLDELKAKIDNLPPPNEGPTSEDFDAAVADLRGHADETMAIIADKPAPVEMPVEEPKAEEPAPVEAPAEASDVPTDVAE